MPDRIALERLPSGVARGVVATEAVVEHRARVVESTRPAAVRSPPASVASISSDACASWPRQAASIISALRSGGFPVASAIRRSSSIISAAVVNSPASRWLLARKLERELQVHERARVAGELRLASGQGVEGFGVPQLERRRSRSALPPASQSQRPASSSVDVQREQQLECSPERRRGRRVPVRQPQRERVQQYVDRTRRFGTGRRGARGLGRLRAGRRGCSGRSTQIAAPSASRCVSRAKAGRTARGVSPRSRSSRPASLPRRCSNAICPRKCSTRARRRPSSGPASTATSSPSAASSAPASRLAAAAASRRCARRSRFGRQHRRALEERGSGGQAPARLGSAGRALELLRDILVGSRRSLGPVPGAAVGIDLRIGDLRQRPMDVLSLLKRRRPVGRRAHQRMTKPHARAELDQSGVDRGGRRVRPDREPLRCSPHQHRVAGRIGRRKPEQAPRLGRKRVEPPPEALLDPPRRPGPRRGVRTRPPTQPASTRAAAPEAPTGYRASR